MVELLSVFLTRDDRADMATSDWSRTWWFSRAKFKIFARLEKAFLINGLDGS
jgi:hypothetical protein